MVGVSQQVNLLIVSVGGFLGGLACCLSLSCGGCPLLALPIKPCHSFVLRTCVVLAPFSSKMSLRQLGASSSACCREFGKSPSELMFIYEIIVDVLFLSRRIAVVQLCKYRIVQGVF